MNKQAREIHDERRTNNQEIREDDHLQPLPTSSDVATLFLDDTLRIKGYTPRLHELFNVATTDIRRPLDKVAHKLGYPRLAEDAERVLRDLRKIDREVQTESGRSCLASLSPYRTVDSKIIGVVIAFIDVTQLREIEERFRLLIEGATDYAMFLVNPSNEIIYWNRGAERVFGWTAEEAVGQSGELVFTPEDRANEEEEKEIAIALHDGRAPDRRWHIRKDGKRIWIDGVMHRLTDTKTGALRGFAKIARDASEQRHTDEALRHARDQLEQRVLERTADLMATNNELERAMTQRDQLERELLNISERERRRIGQDLHDIVCQELTATALFLKSAAKKSGQPDAAKMLDEAAEIVNRNVAVARDLARGFQPTVLAAGGLPAALRTLCKEANERGFHCDLKLPRAIRVRDEIIGLNLFRIAQEAMRNAVTHSHGDEITICVERERDLIRLVIENNGKGFRLRKARKGLGLNIMKYRANVLGGELTITSRRRGGTRVCCEVPVKK